MAEMGITLINCRTQKFSPAVSTVRLDASKLNALLFQEILGSGKSLRLSATGNSMYPLIRSGDRLLIMPVAPHEIAIGDVVFFKHKEDHCLLHRVIRRQNHPDGLRFLLHSDNAVISDGWISSENIFGRLHQLDRADTRLKISQFGMRCLGQWMVINLRWRLNRFNHLRLHNLFIKQLPGLSKYLT